MSQKGIGHKQKVLHQPSPSVSLEAICGFNLPSDALSLKDRGFADRAANSPPLLPQPLLYAGRVKVVQAWQRFHLLLPHKLVQADATCFQLPVFLCTALFPLEHTANPHLDAQFTFLLVPAKRLH